jgi:hypothetical protein
MTALSHMQKVRLWEAAWSGYVRALAKVDETKDAADGRARAGARYSLRVAARKLRQADEKIAQ